MRNRCAIALLAWGASGCHGQPQPALPPSPAMVAGAAGLLGVVTDRHDRPLSQALVRLRVADSPWVLVGDTVTPASGTFAFGGLRPGTFVLNVAMIGFDFSTDTVRLTADHADTLRVHMRASGKPDKHDPF